MRLELRRCPRLGDSTWRSWPDGDRRALGAVRVASATVFADTEAFNGATEDATGLTLVPRFASPRRAPGRDAHACVGAARRFTVSPFHRFTVSPFHPSPFTPFTLHRFTH